MTVQQFAQTRRSSMTKNQSVSEMIASGSLLRKKKDPKTLFNLFERTWRTAFAELHHRESGKFTGKEFGQAKHIVNKMIDLAPELTEAKLETEVREFAQWVFLNWQDAADSLKAANIGKVPGIPTLGAVLLHMNQLYALYRENRFTGTVTARKVEVLAEPAKQPTAPVPQPVQNKVTMDEWKELFGEDE